MWICKDIDKLLNTQAQRKLNQSEKIDRGKICILISD